MTEQSAIVEVLEWISNKTSHLYRTCKYLIKFARDYGRAYTRYEDWKKLLFYISSFCIYIGQILFNEKHQT